MMDRDMPAFCALCGTDQDWCGCQDLAAHHDEIQYHETDRDWHACHACDSYSEGPPDHGNGMHAGVIVDDCPGCDTMGV